MAHPGLLSLTRLAGPGPKWPQAVDGVQSTQQVPLDTAGNVILLNISSLVADNCAATYTSSSGQTQQFTATISLLYLPDNNYSVTKTDLRTGSLWVQPADGSGGPFAPFIPEGFYIKFDEYLLNNKCTQGRWVSPCSSRVISSHGFPPCSFNTVSASDSRRGMTLFRE